MKRYIVLSSCECGRVDDPFAEEYASGDWVRFEDYEKEKANGIKPQLDAVRKKIEKMRLDDNAPQLKQFEKWFAKGNNSAIDKILTMLSEHGV